MELFPDTTDFDTHFTAYLELMRKKVENVLLVSSPYDAFILEEEGSLASRIIREYRGLNLSSPPRLTMVSSGSDALSELDRKPFDLAIVMPVIEDMDVFDLAMKVKAKNSDLPVILLSHGMEERHAVCEGIDKTFIWAGDAELLLALIKSLEDRLNVDSDVEKASVPVLIFVEDSPLYRSLILPLLYKVVVKQTQAVIDESLNEEHRLLKMRARPKILVAENYEKALKLYVKYRPYVFGVISDTRYPKDCVMTEDAGFVLLSQIKSEIPHMPLLLTSSEPANREKARQLQTWFIDKNSPDLFDEIREFFKYRLGFGDFVFRDKNKTEIRRASNFRELENILPEIPDEPIRYHASRNHFSKWFMARSEISLAKTSGALGIDDFENIGALRQDLVSRIHQLRRWRQKGVVVRFNAETYDSEISDFAKTGYGSLGGKARGLAFIQNMLRGSEVHGKYPEVNISAPKTLVVATDGFDSFVHENRLEYLADSKHDDDEIARAFMEAELPGWVVSDLESFLAQVVHPLSVRSSSLLEDARDRPYTGLYDTYMISNSGPDLPARLRELSAVVKLVYASTFFRAPLSFSKSAAKEFQKDSMAVIIQRAAGRVCGDCFYPAISGVARSYNYYPVSPMKAEEGIAQIALGFGKILDDNESPVRFSPSWPNLMPEFSKVEDILENAQRFFYALKIRDLAKEFNRDDFRLERREVSEAENEHPVRSLCSTYVPEENRIRDTSAARGPKIPTFASVLKFDLFPLAALLRDLLEMGKKGMGCPVEIEFSADLGRGKGEKHDFSFLQLRPMSAADRLLDIRITETAVSNAFCYSSQALGNGLMDGIADIVYVRPDRFDPSKTVDIATEIGKLNGLLIREGRRYLLAGPGRWGSADRFLGIPVKWKDISNVAAMVELEHEKLSADPSFGSHFFRKITSLGIFYFTVRQGGGDFFRQEWLESVPELGKFELVRHVRLKNQIVIKCDGRKTTGTMHALTGEESVRG